MSTSEKCPRCNNSSAFNELCDECKGELKAKYNRNLSWDIAYDIEKNWKPSDEFDIFF